MQPHRCAKWYHTPVYRNAALTRQRHIQRPAWPFIDGVSQFKEYIAGVGIEYFRRTLRVFTQPFFDREKTNLLQWQCADFHQLFTHCNIGMAVLICITDTYHGTILKAHSAGTLDLCEKGAIGIINPYYLLSGQWLPGSIDFLARPIGQHAIAIDTASKSHPFQLRVDIRQFNDQHILRLRINRIAKFICAGATAIENGFVVTSDQSIKLAIFTVHAVWLEVLLKECPDLDCSRAL